MSRSLQSRVLSLVGLAVLAAAAGLAILSRQTLRSVEEGFDRAQQRLAATIAQSVARAVLLDLEALQGAAAAPGVDLRDGERAPEQRALAAAARLTSLASVVCFTTPDATPIACDTPSDMRRFESAAVRRAVVEAVRSARPRVSDLIGDGTSIDALLIVPIERAGEPAEGAVVGIVFAGEPRLTALLPSTGATAIVDSTGAAAAAIDGTSEGASAAVPGTGWSVRVGNPDEDVVAPINAFRRRALWLAPTLAAIAMLLAWGVASSVRRPVKALTEAAERIADGNLSDPIQATGVDEIGRLGAALEKMRDRLKRSLDAAEAANVELERRVEQRTAALHALYRELQERERGREQLLRKVISAQEDERRRVARELHDEISQLVAVLGMGLDAAAADAGRVRVAELKGLVDRVHDGLHRIIVNLRPSILDDLGLAAAIEWLAEHQLARTGISTRCELEELQDHRLAPELEIAVFRVVQEAIANISRHAHAATVLIQGWMEDGHLAVEIEDDGCGFDPNEVGQNPETLRGVGLLGMRERMELLGGELRIESAPGNGTRVRLTVPARALQEAGA